jgi:predicted patatin/cPLA2 family phospholipase
MFTTHSESIDGRTYNDGAIQAGIPLPPEPDPERTRILCLLTRPRGYRKKQVKWMRPYEMLRLRGYPPAYRRAYFERIVHYNKAVDRVYNACSGPPILAIAPEPGDFMIGNGETDAARLERAASESYHRTARILGGDLSPWQPYEPHTVQDCPGRARA